MAHPIEAILFDVGGTLRNSVPSSPAARHEKVSQILQLLGAREAPEKFDQLLTQRSQAYTRWSRETLCELGEASLWTQWMLPDWPAEQIAPRALELNQLWRQATGVRELFPESKDVILELFRRGYRLGIVSNTTSSVEVPQALRALRLTGCFETVILSCNVGKRKPGPDILLEATRRMQLQPERCAYVGDRLNRDVEASQKAGFGKVIIRRHPEKFSRHQSRHPDLAADHYVDDLRGLLQIFPALPAKSQPGTIYHASLSTMWARGNFPQLSDFMEASRRIGFSQVELNHQIDSSMLDGMDLPGYPLSSVHEPCPADISTDQLKENDWLMSSPDEQRRRRGVQAVFRSIDLARSLSLPVIVVHCGMVSVDLTDEKQLRHMFKAGALGTVEYQRVRQRMLDKRGGLIEACFQSVKRSLKELLEYADGSGICLGLENRYHYYDIPLPDEMDELLAMADPARLGFVYDVGHAQALDRLGFVPHEDWLRRFSSRILETHLHDVIGVDDHLAPGLGEINFDWVASYLPAEAIRTLELQPGNTPEQVEASLEYLHQKGCIKILKEVSHAHQSSKTTEQIHQADL